MPAGLPAGVTMTKVLVAKTTGGPVTTPAATASSIDFSSAVASTSAPSPCESCSTRIAEDSNDTVTSTPGCSRSYTVSSAVNGSVSEAAARTRSVVSVESSEPQEAARRTATTAAPILMA